MLRRLSWTLCLPLLGLALIAGSGSLPLAPAQAAPGTETNAPATAVGTPSLAPGQPGLQNAASANVIKSVIMAMGASADTSEPVNPTIVFSPNSTIHAIVAIDAAPANTEFKATWYVTDVGSAAPRNSLLGTFTLTGTGTRNLDFTLIPRTTWPAGIYRVEISVNGQVQRITDFTVSQQATPTGSALSPTPAQRLTGTPAPRATATAVPESVVTSTLASGWIRYEMQTSKFALALPSTWSELDLSPAGLDSSLAAVAPQNPQFSAMFSSQAFRQMLIAGLKFFAVQWPATPGTNPLSSNVIKAEMPFRATLDAVVSVTLSQLSGIADPTVPITHSRVILSGVPAERFKYRSQMLTLAGQSLRLDIVQYVLIDDTAQYVITYESFGDLSDADAAVFEQSAQSFRLIKLETVPVGPATATALPSPQATKDAPTATATTRP